MSSVTEFEQRLKKFPPITPGIPDPFTPPNQESWCQISDTLLASTAMTVTTESTMC
jgi:hypothetical protein